MTLNLPLLYVLWLEEYCQISPNKKQITKPLTRNKHFSLLYFWAELFHGQLKFFFKKQIGMWTTFVKFHCKDGVFCHSSASYIWFMIGWSFSLVTLLFAFVYHKVCQLYLSVNIYRWKKVLDSICTALKLST